MLCSIDALAQEDGIMKSAVTLLLTNDAELEETVAQALAEIGGLSHLTRCARDTLETVWGVGQALDLVLIDFNHGFHGLSLLSAINLYRKDLPIIAITHDDEKHVAVLAYACGASTCLSKPVTSAGIVAVIEKLCPLERQLPLVA